MHAKRQTRTGIMVLAFSVGLMSAAFGKDGNVSPSDLVKWSHFIGRVKVEKVVKTPGDSYLQRVTLKVLEPLRGDRKLDKILVHAHDIGYACSQSYFEQGAEQLVFLQQIERNQAPIWITVATNRGQYDIKKQVVQGWGKGDQPPGKETDYAKVKEQLTKLIQDKKLQAPLPKINFPHP